MIADKAGKLYWDNTDANQRLRGGFDGHARGLRNLAKRRWHSVFVRALSGRPAGAMLLELGCGGSHFLPYFAREFGFAVSGMDYSEAGCKLAREICRTNGCPADIVCSDFFEAPGHMKAAFDIVVSFGVVEHFTETARVLAIFKTFLRPGGLMITSVPNLGGIPGAAQTLLHRGILEKHVVLTSEEVKAAHESAGMLVHSCEYFPFLNFGVLNPGDSGCSQQLLWQGLRAITGVTWAIESTLGPLPSNRVSSPYIFCVSRVPL